MRDLSKFPFKPGDKVCTIHGNGYLYSVNPLVVNINSNHIKIFKSEITQLDYYYTNSARITMNVLDIPYVYARNIINKHGITKESTKREDQIIWWLVYGAVKSKIQNKLK